MDDKADLTPEQVDLYERVEQVRRLRTARRFAMAVVVIAGGVILSVIAPLIIMLYRAAFGQ